METRQIVELGRRFSFFVYQLKSFDEQGSSVGKELVTWLDFPPPHPKSHITKMVIHACKFWEGRDKLFQSNERLSLKPKMDGPWGTASEVVLWLLLCDVNKHLLTLEPTTGQTNDATEAQLGEPVNLGLLTGVEIIQRQLLCQSSSQPGWQLRKARDLEHTAQRAGSLTNGSVSLGQLN